MSFMAEEQMISGIIRKDINRHEKGRFNSVEVTFFR